MDTSLFNERSSSQLIAMLKDICNDKMESTLTSSLEKALQLSNSLKNILCLDLQERTELEHYATKLWNKAVVLNAKKNVQIHAFAKMRQISFQVISFVSESTTDVRDLKKQIVMALKTARAWIDCKEIDMADKVLNTFNLLFEKLQHILIEKKNALLFSGVVEKEKHDLDKDYFCYQCLKVEMRVLQSQHKEAFFLFEKAEEMLTQFPDEAGYLSKLSYNFGVDCYQERLFEMSITWIRESYNLGKDATNISKQMQAQTLRLLANCYMEWGGEGWQDNALIAIELANKEDSHVAGIYLKFQLLLLTQSSLQTIKQALNDLLNHPDSNMDLLLNALQLEKKQPSEGAAFDLRQTIIAKFEMKPDVGTLVVTMMDLFLKESNTDKAKAFTEECIIAHNSGHRYDGATVKRLHILFWAKAAQLYENNNFAEAVVWYNYSLSLYPSMSQSEPNLGKLQRNLATCYLHLGETSKAFSAIELSERCEPDNAHTYFLMFKISLEMDDLTKTMASLNKLVECVSKNKNEDSNIICLAAHNALEQEKLELAIPALESLIAHSVDHKVVITALRCLLRLLVTQMDGKQSIKNAVGHIRTAYNRLVVAQNKGDIVSAEVQEEASWFMKIAWNLALNAKDNLSQMKELFILCFQLLTLCSADIANHNRKQHCLLMACAACLTLSRDEDNKPQQTDFLEEVLLHIEEYKQEERRTKNSIWAQGLLQSSSAADKFLIIYEFEALTKLNDPKAESVLERALLCPNPDPKLFHTLAALAMDSPANNIKLCVKALKVSIRMHLTSEKPDYSKCSADLRSLIELAMKENEEEALTYLKETFDVIEKAKGCYPEIEIVWLMTKSWNYGLQYYNCCKFTEAEQWCSLSVRLLKYLSSTKEEYEEQMMSLYGELLTRLESHSGGVEE
ncbi:testis-expressed protein 11-like [Physella acuta]|uniref:testis-expressed protein 11-like n=1 Tax=Physella acuta TaxID=109671 RepID=UPI0027DB2996|nr:testis-expressed protein 11-like [Physella acuta]